MSATKNVVWTEGNPLVAGNKLSLSVSVWGQDEAFFIINRVV